MAKPAFSSVPSLCARWLRPAEFGRGRMAMRPAGGWMKYDPKRHHRRSIRLREYDYSSPGAYFTTLCTHDEQCLFGEIVDGHMHRSQYGEIVQEEWLRSATIRKEIQLDAWVVMPNHVHGIVIITSPAGAHGHAPAIAPEKAEAHGNEPTPGVSSTVGAHGDVPAIAPEKAEAHGDVPAIAPEKAEAHGNVPTPGVSSTVGAHGDVPAIAPEKAEAHGDVPYDRTPRGTTSASIVTRAHGHAPLRNAPPQRRPRSLGTFVSGFKSAVKIRVNQMRGAPGAPVWQHNYYEHVVRNEDELNQIREYILNNPLRWALDRENPGRVVEAATAGAHDHTSQQEPEWYLL
jgi:REP-associated tyrosine transposase